MVGLLAAAGLLLAVAGISKVRTPLAAQDALGAARLRLPRRLGTPVVVRLIGLAQVLAGIAVVSLDRRVAGAVVLVAYGTLAGFAWRLSRVAPDQGCGCFGADDGPVSARHVAVDVAFAGVGAWALVLPGAGFLRELAAQPLLGLPLVALTALLAYACYLLMTALPDLSAARTASEGVR